MNDRETSRAMKVRALNDCFRRTLQGGSVLMTAGVVALGPEAQGQVLAAVQNFDAFNDANNPWGEHDFGAFDIEGNRLFFKIEYYDLTRAMHSEDPTDPSKTERVMTIMLASEY